jgi:hypothetical protein
LCFCAISQKCNRQFGAATRHCDFVVDVGVNIDDDVDDAGIAKREYIVALSNTTTTISPATTSNNSATSTSLATETMTKSPSQRKKAAAKD